MSEYKMDEKPGIDGKPVQVIGATYEAGAPASGETVKWKKNLETREEYMKYLKESERYWYMKNDEWFGSEKRKTPA